MKGLKFLAFFFVLTVIFACSEEPKVETSKATTNSIIAIDEANKILKAYNLVTGEISTVLNDIGNAANDIEIDGDYGYIVVSIDNKLLRINFKDNSLSVINFPSGANPFNLVVDGDRIYITLAVSNQLSIVSKNSFSIITNINLLSPGYPMGIRVSSDKIYIATSEGYIDWGNPNNYNNSRIEVYSKQNYAFITNVSLSYKNPTSLWVDDTNLYIACTGEYNGTGKVLKMITTTYSVSEVNIPATNASFVAVYDNKLCVIEDSWVGIGGFYVYDLNSSNLTNKLSGKNLKNIVYHNGDIFVSEGYGGNKIYRFKLSDLSDKGEIGIGGGDIAVY